MNAEITPKPVKYFNCECCGFTCSKLSDWKRHISTSKHLHRITLNNLEQDYIQTDKFICKICCKSYKARNSLWYHEQKCKPIEESAANVENTILDASSNEIKLLTNLVLELVKNNTEIQKQTTELQKQNQNFQKQNQDLQKQMIDVCQKIQPGNTNINSNNTTNNNKTFNLQLFLNEECKDAMNMSEFINSIQLKLSDLENMSTLGYTEGISKIILNEMNVIDQNKRPVHCTDIKRDILYVKDEDKWEKEQPEFPKLKQVIRKVEQKNFGLMGEWQAEHPDYKDSTTHENTEFLKLVSQAMSGTPENMHKVIKRIAKEVVINK
jgi:hypothetical protein